MNNHKQQPACHSNKVPVRQSREPWRDGGKLCYMDYEAALKMDNGCFGCKHAKDARIQKHYER